MYLKRCFDNVTSQNVRYDGIYLHDHDVRGEVEYLMEITHEQLVALTGINFTPMGTMTTRPFMNKNFLVIGRNDVSNYVYIVYQHDFTYWLARGKLSYFVNASYNSSTWEWIPIESGLN